MSLLHMLFRVETRSFGAYDLGAQQRTTLTPSGAPSILVRSLFVICGGLDWAPVRCFPARCAEISGTFVYFNLCCLFTWDNSSMTRHSSHGKDTVERC